MSFTYFKQNFDRNINVNFYYRQNTFQSVFFFSLRIMVVWKLSMRSSYTELLNYITLNVFSCILNSCFVSNHAQNYNCLLAELKSYISSVTIAIAKRLKKGSLYSNMNIKSTDKDSKKLKQSMGGKENASFGPYRISY